MKVLAKYTRVSDMEILAELYRIYGVKYLEPIPRVRLDAVEDSITTTYRTRWHQLGGMAACFALAALLLCFSRVL